MTKEHPQTLGAKIRALRVAKGLTQGELAQGDVTPGLISQIESDRVAPSLRVAAMIAKQLGVSEDYLVPDMEERSRQSQALRDIRERLHAGDGAQAEQMICDLQRSDILYVQALELRLEFAFARELQGFVDQALTIYEEVALDAMIARDHLVGANCSNRQGDYYERIGQLSRAFYCYSQGLDHLSKMTTPPTSLLVYTYRSMAICAYRMGDSTTAVPLATECYQLLQDSVQHQDFAEICHFLSVLLMDVGDKENALKFASLAVRLYRVLGRSEALTDAMMNEVIVHRSLGNFRDAMKSISALITDYYDQGRLTRLTNAWTERALCEVGRGMNDDAERSLERCFSWAEPDTPEYAEALRVRAQLQWLKGDHETALLSYEEALGTLLKHHLISESRELLQTLIDRYREIRDHKNYQACLKKKVQLETKRNRQLRTLALSTATR